MYNGYI
jgi:hypothetical protein